jgi:hypothetical protein
VEAFFVQRSFYLSQFESDDNNDVDDVAADLQVELVPPLVPALGFAEDRVAGSHPDPLRDLPVLL